MADNNNQVPGGTPLNGPAGDSSLTEIDFDSFLNAQDGVSASIEDDIRGLFDAEADKPSQAAPQPFAPPESPSAGEVSADRVPSEAFFNPKPDAPAAGGKSDSILDELNSLLSELHADAKAGSDAFSGLLDDIESNKALAEAQPAQEQQLNPSDTPAKESDAPAPAPEQEYRQISVDDDIDNLAAGSIFGDEEPADPDALNDILNEAPAPLPEAPVPQPEEPAANQNKYFKKPAQQDNAPAASDTPEIPAAPAPMPYAQKLPSVMPAAEKKPKQPSAVFPSKGDSTAEIIRKLVLLVSVVTIIVSSGILVNTYLYQPSLAKSQNEKAQGDLLSDDVHEASRVMEDNKQIAFPEGMLTKYAKLYAANPDMSGWISIPALEINFPLAQGKNNEQYLTRDIYNKRVKYGVPFFDYRNHLKTLDRNTIVYGHNMRYDDMIFGLLENYCTISGFKSAPVIECNTLYADYKWKVYAVFITNANAKDDNGNIFNYNFTEHNDVAFTEYIQMVDERKLYTTGVDMLPTDKILTLSTCFYEFDDARLVVIARLVRDGESTDVDTSLAVKNDNPHYPQAWYDAKNKKNPYA